MKDSLIRGMLALIAGFTYLSGAIPENMPVSEIASLPLQVWLLFAVNVMTAIASPSVVKGVAAAAVGAKK